MPVKQAHVIRSINSSALSNQTIVSEFPTLSLKDEFAMRMHCTDPLLVPLGVHLSNFSLCQFFCTSFLYHLLMIQRTVFEQIGPLS